MRVLLDTQMLYLMATLTAEQLHMPQTGVPAKVQKLLADPNTEMLVSAISILEIAIKSEKIVMTEKQVRQAAEDLGVSMISFTPQHSYRLFSLPRHHKDPFDRVIIATALVEGIPLVGADRMFRKYRGLQVIWN